MTSNYDRVTLYSCASTRYPERWLSGNEQHSVTLWTLMPRRPILRESTGFKLICNRPYQRIARQRRRLGLLDQVVSHMWIQSANSDLTPSVLNSSWTLLIKYFGAVTEVKFGDDCPPLSIRIKLWIHFRIETLRKSAQATFSKEEVQLLCHRGHRRIFKTKSLCIDEGYTSIYENNGTGSPYKYTEDFMLLIGFAPSCWTYCLALKECRSQWKRRRAGGKWEKNVECPYGDGFTLSMKRLRHSPIDDDTIKK